jgi:hypothetical protein
MLQAAIVFLAALLFFSHLAADLPVLREMRGVIFYDDWINHFSPWDELLYPVGGNSAATRVVGILFALLDARVCGFSAPCTNAGQAILLATAACLLFLHLVQLLDKSEVAVVLALSWCLSLAAIEGGLWQATQLDKLAMSFSLLYMIVLFHFVRHSKPSAAAYAACNLLLVVLLLLAFKSKEIAFFLVPVTLLVVLVEGMAGGVNGVLAKARLTVIPVVYGTYYLQYYLRHLPDDMRIHVGSGDPMVAVPVLLFDMLGDGSALGTGDWGNDHALLAAAAAITMTLLLILAATSTIVARYRSAAGLDRSARNGIYLVAVLVCNLVTLASTAHPQAYYLMIAEGALFGLIGVAVTAPIRGIARRMEEARRLTLLGLLAVSVMLGYAAQRMPGSATVRIQAMSRIVNDSFATIRTAVPAEAIKDAQFLFPAPIDGDWYFFGSINNDERPDPEMLSFVYRKRVPVYVNYLYGPIDLSPPNPPATMRVVWNVDGTLSSIDLGDQHVLAAARH